MPRLTCLVLLLFSAACATHMPNQNELVSSLEVDVTASAVRFTIHLTNPGEEPVTLEFASSQRYDFTVSTASGEKIWRSSEDMMFTQALGRETIAPGESRDFSETWQPGGRTGRLIAVGQITATGRHLEQRTEFELGKR